MKPCSHIHSHAGYAFRVTLYLLLFSCSPVQLTAQQEPPPFVQDSGWTLKQYGAFTLSSGIFTAVLIDSYFAWWAGNSQKFGFYDPIQKRGEWFHEQRILGLDKLGHAYSAYFFYAILKAVMEWGGFQRNEAVWWSAGFSYGVLTLMEIGDGFSDYSFDYRDIIMNTAGLLFGLGREYVPFMKYMNFKWSYVPETLSFRISQQYHASTFWFTTDIVSLVTGNTGDPFIVSPAIGMSVTPNGGAQEILIGLDFDFNALLRSNNEYFEVIRKVADPIHVPAPAMKVSKGYHPRYSPFMLR